MLFLVSGLKRLIPSPGTFRAFSMLKDKYLIWEFILIVIKLNSFVPWKRDNVSELCKLEMTRTKSFSFHKKKSKKNCWGEFKRTFLDLFLDIYSNFSRGGEEETSKKMKPKLSSQKNFLTKIFWKIFRTFHWKQCWEKSGNKISHYVDRMSAKFCGHVLWFVFPRHRNNYLDIVTIRISKSRIRNFWIKKLWKPRGLIHLAF